MSNIEKIDAILEEMREGVRNGPVRIKELKEAGVPVVGTRGSWSTQRAASRSRSAARATSR